MLLDKLLRMAFTKY